METLIRFALGFMLVLTALFLILLVLIQRGRGGGLTGALGGAGGQSAFGTKAGDVFTRITVGVAAFWIGLCILALNALGQRKSPLSETLGGNAPTAIMPQTQPTTPVVPPGGGSAPDAKPAEDGPVLPPADGGGPPAANPATATPSSPESGGPTPPQASPAPPAAPAETPAPPPATEPAGATK